MKYSITIQFLFRTLKPSDYMDFTITAAAEIPVLLLILFLEKFIGMKGVMASSAVIFSSSFLLMLSGIGSQKFYVICATLARGFASAILTSSFIYTPKLFKTKIRALGIGKIILCIAKHVNICLS